MQKIVIKPLLATLISLTVLAPAIAQAIPPELYSGLKWRLIGPFRGGRVAAVAGIPGSSTTFYFGSVSGGVWQTTDAGVVWKPIFDGQPVASIGALAVAPSDPKTIYAGTGESDIRSNLSSGDGVYKSTDSGQTWANIGLRDSRQISRIVIDPQNANIVYVGALGHAYAPNKERGVYKSSDGGATWTKVLDQGPDIGVSDLAIATQDSSVLFATTWRSHRPPWSTYAPIDGPGGGLFRSQDGGQTWSHITANGLPEGEWGRTAVAVSPNGKRVYALVSASKKPGLYRSDDGGSTWTLQNDDRRLTSRAWYFGNITVDPNNPDVIYLPNVALYRSEDGGKTISIVRGAPGGDDYHQIWIDPKDSSRMILGTDQGTTISLDYGQTWSTWYNQPTAQFYHVITDDQFPYVVYGTQQDSGSAAVRSRGDSGLITPRDWSPAGGSESGYIAPDPKDPNIVYLTGTYGDVTRFNRRTSFSQDITPWPMSNFGVDINARKYRDPWTPILLFSPFDKKTLYLGTQYVMKTLDGGLHWEIISPDLTGATPASQRQEARRPTHGRERKAARIRRRLRHRAVQPERKSHLGRQRHRSHPPHAGWRKNLERYHAPRRHRLEQNLADRSLALRSRRSLRRRRSASPRRPKAISLSHSRLRSHLATDHRRHRRLLILTRRPRRSPDPRPALRRNRTRRLRFLRRRRPLAIPAVEFAHGFHPRSGHSRRRPRSRNPRARILDSRRHHASPPGPRSYRRCRIVVLSASNGHPRRQR